MRGGGGRAVTSRGSTLFAALLAGVLPACGAPVRAEPFSAAVRAEPGDCVIVIHGLARTDASMRPMRAALTEHGYLVVGVTYPSRELPIEELSERTLPALVRACRDRDAHRIHFVTHSLGGILLRHYLEGEALNDIGRTVMLAPPNQGSEVVDNWRRVPGYGLINGPAGQQLGTGPDSVPLRLGPLRSETGIVAGTRTINLILSLSLPNPDDGKVSVASTRVENMCAHLQVPVSHPFIMRDEAVIAEVLSYLGTGRFLSEKAEYPDCPFRDG